MREQVGWNVSSNAAERAILKRDLKEACPGGSTKKVDKIADKICKK